MLYPRPDGRMPFSEHAKGTWKRTDTGETVEGFTYWEDLNEFGDGYGDNLILGLVVNECTPATCAHV